MLPALIAIGVGGFILARYWDKIVDWLKRFTREIVEIFKEYKRLEHATKILAKITGDPVLAEGMTLAYILYHRIFYKADGEWYESVTTAKVPPSEVPAWAKSGVNESEVNVTSRYQRELSLTL